MTARSVDLSADVGEATTASDLAVERALLELVSSAHVACGGHAGDAESMDQTVRAALEHGVEVGAHPSYPDREGFGRRAMTIDHSALTASLRQQLGALVEVCQGLDTALHSVKAHGALYAEVALGGPSFDALRAAMVDVCAPGTALVLPAGSAALDRCADAGLAVRVEGFCDRAYAPDGTLVDRSLPGAVFDDPELAAEQAVRLAAAVDSLCLHGDTPGVVGLATAVRRALEQAGVVVAAPG